MIKADIESVLACFRDEGMDAGCEFNGKFWEVWIGSHGGGREDGIGLAKELAEKVRGVRKACAPETVPESVSVPVPDPKDKIIADLESALAAAAAPKPEAKHIPPPELADLIEINETAPETHERLTRLYADAKQGAELARGYGGTFNGRSTVEWERKAERYESGLKWNRGRMAETI